MPNKDVKKHAPEVSSAKEAQLEQFTEDAEGQFLTSNQGVRINDNQNSLRGGSRGPTLLEDHFLREKLTHFDHERIPERVVHARGSAAHGTFVANGAASKYTKATFLKKGVTTPVFTRFSTVAGSRGSTDVARDVRGFATKFYTQQGVFDLVGNNMPVFFIQDAIKFPDLIHAVKPEPHNEIPQAQSAHDTFWDFISLNTESAHMIMWLMSDRAVPRSFRMMEGFGVHTFKMIDDENNVNFIKFHWKPRLGVASLLWDEALKISGKDPDFHRRDLWDAIESGAFPQWDLGIQVVPEADEFKFDFDLLDPTKLIPEELVPVEVIGTMTLDRNPDNFFAETEQVAFCISHIVPGLDFTNDPLLQGRLFSYLDTQLKRLGGPNFHELPINKSLAPIHNNQRDGHMRQTINRGRASYEPNRVGGGCPFQAGGDMSGFKTAVEKMQGIKVRDRNLSFVDHFNQARMFYLSQTPVEQQHMIDAFQFELLHCTDDSIKERVIAVIQQVDTDLANKVAAGLGIATPVAVPSPLNLQFPADAPEGEYQSKSAAGLDIAPSKALSILANPVPSVETLKVAFLLAKGFDEKAVAKAVADLRKNGATPCVVAPLGGTVAGDQGGSLKVDFALPATGSVLFDALYIGSTGKSADLLMADAKAKLFIAETYKHCKPIAMLDGSQNLVIESLPGPKIKLDNDLSKEGIVVLQKSTSIKEFEAVLAQKRFHTRTDIHKVIV